MIRAQTCPICDRALKLDAAQSSTLFPFCSERCRQVDLFRWAEGKYAIVEPLDPKAADPQSFDPEDFDPDAHPSTGV